MQSRRQGAPRATPESGRFWEAGRGKVEQLDLSHRGLDQTNGLLPKRRLEVSTCKGLPKSGPKFQAPASQPGGSKKSVSWYPVVLEGQIGTNHSGASLSLNLCAVFEF